jgi:DNA replicative helicase MCM subunit Mcm2 (Cdc46/Mcm family)
VAKLTTAEEVFSRFIEDFRDEEAGIKYDQAIAELGIKGLKSLVIDFSDLYTYDLDLAGETLR